MSGQVFENEILKLKWLLVNGFIDVQQLRLFAQLYNVDPESIYERKIIVVRPSKFSKIIKEQGSLAGIADPYTRMFPVISLLSLEKTINSLADLRVPWRTFKIVVDNDYRNAPLVAFKLLLDIVDILNKHGYNITVQLPQSVESAKKYYNFDTMPLQDELKRVICHLLKRLGEKTNCEDKDWPNYDLWGKTKKENIDMDKVRRIAVDMGLPVVVVKYVVIARNNRQLLEKYKESFNLTDREIEGIINRYEYGIVDMI